MLMKPPMMKNEKETTKMKKIIALALSSVLALGLVACGGSNKIADGTYKAQVDEATAEASHGWTEVLAVTYQDGKMTDVDFDAFDAEGNRKSEADPATYPMDPPPSVWIPQIEENIKATSSADKVATVAGATSSSENAKKLYAAVLEAASAGKMETVVVTMPAKEK